MPTAAISLQRPLKIACVGGGPAGLYFALLMKKQQPRHEVIVYERNVADDTFGWGVVFSDQTLGHFSEADPESQASILQSFAHWDDIEIQFRNRTIRSTGHGFCGISRLKLLQILQNRCTDLGVTLEMGREIKSVSELDEADLIVATDGVNSIIRQEFSNHFKPEIDERKNRFIWLGTHKVFDAFSFLFVESEWGWFQAHAYRFDANTSTFIVETSQDCWRRAGLDCMTEDESIAFVESLFSEFLDGQSLMSRSAHLRGSAAWLCFKRVSNRNWVKDNIVLMGDAAHTAHFSIGSGTKLAMEDAIALAHLLNESDDRSIPQVLEQYESERKIEVLKIQSAARNSTEWFENVDRYTALPPEQFAYSLLTRSQRVSHEGLRQRDRVYLDHIESWFSQQADRVGSLVAVPPMFTPFSLRDMHLVNRVVVSPMAMYSAVDGVPGDFYLVHLGTRALGGAGLIFSEMTVVSPGGRITPGCAGIWNDEQGASWQRIVAFVHEHSQAKVCLQLGHSGPKGSTRLGWEGMDVPLERDNWSLLAASAIPWSADNQVPRAASRSDMDRVVAEFVAAAKRGADSGFDMLELHAAHGYLLSSFISPLTNQRTDEYGGSLDNRIRFPLEVFREVRRVWPQARPMSVRLSVTDWHKDGLTDVEGVAVAQAFKNEGVDLIDVSTGQTSTQADPVYGRMYQVPFADRIRNEIGVATLAVGNIFEADHVNSILASGRADLVALARPHLSDPFWTLRAAAELNYDSQAWPPQYLAGRDQQHRNLDRTGQLLRQI
tara:strand:+ start:905 stop:3232 length:2328 start_codon:yes stop_codon:yes gene_type:complete